MNVGGAQGRYQKRSPSFDPNISDLWGAIPNCVYAKQWKKEQIWPFFGCCTADSQTYAGRHQLYNNGSLVLLPTAWSTRLKKVQK